MKETNVENHRISINNGIDSDSTEIKDNDASGNSNGDNVNDNDSSKNVVTSNDIYLKDQSVAVSEAPQMPNIPISTSSNGNTFDHKSKHHHHNLDYESYQFALTACGMSGDPSVGITILNIMEESDEYISIDSWNAMLNAVSG